LENSFFQRELTGKEKEYLHFILPENKPGYLHYRNLISEYSVVGKCSGNRTGFILGKKNSVSDNDIPPSPLFALGCKVESDKITDILVYQKYDNFIEVEINCSNNSETSGIKRSWTYSDWVPGNKSPEDDSMVKEIQLTGGKYTFTIAPESKRIWLHEHESGINFIIPVTNYFNELMRYKNIRDPKIALNPAGLFVNLETYSNNDLVNALLSYQKYLKRFSLKIDSDKNKIETQSSHRSFFRRNKN
jgi:hypothetical protein